MTQRLIRMRHPVRWLASRLDGVRPDLGMSTAEYAVGTLAACGFAGLLVSILRSPAVQSLLVGIITKALSLGG